MNLQKNSYFNLVKVPSEKKKIFQKLIEHQSEILMKGDGDDLYRLRPRKIADGRWLMCDYEPGPTPMDPIYGFKVIHSANFAVDDERYFFRSAVQISPRAVMLELKVDLYHLQRRKSMRLKVPSVLGAECRIINHNDRSHLLDCQILDFSTGGLRLEFNGMKPAFEPEDHLVLTLRLGEHRKQLQVEAVIRHVFSAEDKFSQTFGVKFVEVDKYLQNKLIALHLDLQTDIFRKWKRHQL